MLLLMIVFSEIPKIESNLAGYNIDNNPYDIVAERLTSLFASTNMVQVKVRLEETNVKTLFDGLEELEKEIAQRFPGTRVESLNSAADLFRLKFSDNDSVEDLLNFAVNIPVIKNLVSEDAGSVLLVAYPNEADKFSPSCFDEIIKKEYPGIESMIAVSQSHIQTQIEKSIKRDYYYLIPIILIFTIFFLFVSFRSKGAVLFCMINVLLSFIPALFFITLYNVKINQITTSALPIVVILSLSTSIHLISGYTFHSYLKDKRKIVIQTLKHYFVPSLLSVLTTAIAFFSFYLSDSLYIRQFGIVAASSLITVFLLTYMISPLTLSFVKETKKTPFMTWFASSFEKTIFNNKKRLSILFFIIAGSSLFFITEITFKTNLETFIPRRTAVYENIKEVRNSFHSLAEIDLLFEQKNDTNEGNNKEIDKEVFISYVSDFSKKIENYPEVQSVQSIKDQVDFEKSFMGFGFRTDLFPRKGNPFVSDDQKKYRINIKLDDPEDIFIVKNKLSEDFLKYNSIFQYSIYSDYLFFDYISSSITNSLLRSLLFSALLIFIIIFFLTLSIKKTIFSIFANAVPLGFLILIFVGFAIDMNISTSITLIVCLGLIVDDTIQILYRMVRLNKPLKELGFGILTTSIIITGCFFSFILSKIHPIQVFGILCGLVFMLAAIGDLTIFPWLLKPHSKTRKNP